MGKTDHNYNSIIHLKNSKKQADTLFNRSFITFGILVLLFSMGGAFGQKSVKGVVKDDAGKRLSSANVFLLNDKGVVLCFAISDDKGDFSLPVTDSLMPVYRMIVATMMGYHSDTLLFSGINATLELRLSQEVIELQNVQVNNSRQLLRRKNDTLIYSADSLAYPQDRVIGDVIKKIPGIDIDENGRILYQGKPINRFYIDGDNLVNGNYNSIADNLPNNMVSSIQVLQNHQPVNVLSDIDISNTAALNIVLKDNARAKLITDGSVSAGHPGIYNIIVNNFFFSKKFKLLSAIKANNNGEDISKDVTSLFGGMGISKVSESLFGISPDYIPLLKRRYFMNKSGLINLNTLIKFSKQSDLRIGLSYLSEHIDQQSSIKNMYILPSDTVRIETDNVIHRHSEVLNPTLSFTSNLSNFLLTNNLSIISKRQTDLSDLNSNIASQIRESYNYKLAAIFNQFRLIKHIGTRALIDAYSTLMYSDDPQDETFTPGLRPGFYNQGNTFRGLYQTGGTPSFASTNYINIRLMRKISPTFRIGADIERKKLLSELQVIQNNNNNTSLPDSFSNRINWQRNNYYIEAGVSYVHNKMEVEVHVPYTINQTFYFPDNHIIENVYRWQGLQPSIIFRLPYTTGGNISVNAGRNLSFGDLPDVYTGLIQTSYRDIGSKGGVLPASLQWYVATEFSKNILANLLFYNLSIEYTNRQNKTTGYLIIDTLFTNYSQILLNNTTNSLSISSSVSKYFIPLRSTLTVSGRYNLGKTNQFQNGIFLPFSNNAYVPGLKLLTKINNRINVSYEGYLSFTTMQPLGESNQLPELRTATSLQKISFNLRVQNWMDIKWVAEHYHSMSPGRNNTSQVFLDATMTMYMQKLHSYVEFSFLNLLNQKNFSIVTQDANMISQKDYKIRPFNAFVKFSFRFH